MTTSERPIYKLFQPFVSLGSILSWFDDNANDGVIVGGCRQGSIPATNCPSNAGNKAERNENKVDWLSTNESFFMVCFPISLFERLNKALYFEDEWKTSDVKWWMSIWLPNCLNLNDVSEFHC